VILTAAVRRSIPKTAFPSNRTRLEDETFVVNLDDLDTLVGDFYRAGDQRRYSTLRVLADWSSTFE
jgi:hypothetical protein